MSTADLFVSGSDYHRTIESLIERIHRSDWAFDHIVCIARGGLQAGDILSRVFQKPLGILLARKDNGVPQLSEGLSALQRLQGAVLLVDDIAATGGTLMAVDKALRTRYPEVRQIRTAVLWRQPDCVAEINYCAAPLAHNTRIHLPHEPFELNSLQALVERVGQREKTIK